MGETIVLTVHKNLSCVETSQSFLDPFSQLCSLRPYFLNLLQYLLLSSEFSQCASQLLQNSI